MKTEELNDYIFADMVQRKAHVFWCRAIEKLEKEGIPSEEAEARVPHVDTFIPMAMARFCELKSKVFQALHESNQVPHE